MTPQEQVVLDLEAARSELVARGLTRGEWIDDSGRVCALGAIRVAVFGEHIARSNMDFVDLGSGRVNAAVDALGRALPGPFAPPTAIWQKSAYVVEFNDDSATTITDVLHLYDEAILSEKEKL